MSREVGRSGLGRWLRLLTRLVNMHGWLRISLSGVGTWCMHLCYPVLFINRYLLSVWLGFRYVDAGSEDILYGGFDNNCYRMYEYWHEHRFPL